MAVIGIDVGGTRVGVGIFVGVTLWIVGLAVMVGIRLGLAVAVTAEGVETKARPESSFEMEKLTWTDLADCSSFKT